jgi:hypothetical protein
MFVAICKARIFLRMLWTKGVRRYRPLARTRLWLDTADAAGTAASRLIALLP